MTTPSNIAAATLALRNLLKAAMPPEVEMTTLAPAQAEHFSPQPKAVARLNVALYRLATSPHRKNAGFVRLGANLPPQAALPPLDLRYLITAYAAQEPAAKNSAERLLEAALHAINGHPVLTTAQLEAALPGESASGTNRTAAVELEDLTQADLLNLFVNLRAEWRPAVTVLVRLSDG